MGFDNTVTIVGNVTRDPELRFSQAGMPIATFGVAWNRRRQDGEDEVSFFNIVCFRRLAENVAESVGKGARVVVYGTLQQRRWENQEGESRNIVEILADDVAPSLRWATAQVHRNEYRDDNAEAGYSRRGGYSGGDGYGGGSPGPASGRQSSPRSESSRSPAPTSAAGAGAASSFTNDATVDEEPF